MEQPQFGRRLKALRLRQGLSQVALAGDGMSSAYLSRLESGTRPPTPRAVRYLAERLGLAVEDFEAGDPAPLSNVLASIISAADSTAGSEELAEALASDSGDDPALQWQGLWLLAD